MRTERNDERILLVGLAKATRSSVNWLSMKLVIINLGINHICSSFTLSKNMLVCWR